MEDVRGYCPMGCGQTLFVAEGGHITCSWGMCPNPSAVDELLGDRETEHIVDLGMHDFALQHPLRERINGDLFSCSMHHELVEVLGEGGLPWPPGHRYRVRDAGGPWEQLQ